MDVTFAAKEVLDFIGVAGCYFKTEGGITRIAHPVQITARNIIVFSGTDIENHGYIMFRMIDDTELSIRVKRESDLETPGVFLLTFEEVLPADFASKIVDVSKTVRRANRRSEERFEFKNTDEAIQFGLSSPVVTLSNGNQHVKCIINNASLHGVKLTGDRSLIAKGSAVIFSCRFKDAKSPVAQKAFVVDIGRIEKASSYFSYSLHFIDPVAFLWQRHIVAIDKCITFC